MIETTPNDRPSDQPRALQQQLDHWLEVEFSHIDTAKICAQLFSYAPERRQLLSECVKRISATNVQLAQYFVEQLDEKVEAMDEQTLCEWTYHAMDQYDRLGLNHAASVLDQADIFVQKAHDRSVGALLNEHKAVLQPFLRGLSGRSMEIEQSESLAYTDTAKLYLPEITTALDNQRQNFKLLKASLTFAWAQTRYGSYQFGLLKRLQALSPPQLQAYQALEAHRLLSIIGRELPGLARQMQEICRQLTPAHSPVIPASIRTCLENNTARAEDSLALVSQLSADQLPRVLPFQGEVRLDQVEQVMLKRIEREKAFLRVKLAELAEENQLKPAQAENSEAPLEAEKTQFQINPDSAEAFDFELSVEADALGIPEDVQALLTSIQMDFGEIPDEHLVAAGPGEYCLQDYEEAALDPEDVWSGTYHEEGAFLYPEWDFKRQRNRNNWCVVRELEVNPVHNSFHADTLSKYSRLIKSIHRTFETLRGEYKTLRKQDFGEDIDLDALVDSWSDLANGHEASARLFTRKQKEDRNIAVMFMVDMSGSTKGWINEAERESLILLCETLEKLGDRYAIYGFSGITRKRCELYRVKSFEDRYDKDTIARISGIEAKDYTRMGAAIRHLTMRLNEVDARIKLMITLSDGKPEDYDGYYRTEYGIHDTRQALHEARRNGIHPFCITIDEHAAEYLPQLYGQANYTVLKEVAHLPLKISDIYRKLTT